MKLLVCTQVYDAKDPVLGFFVRWVEEFKKYGEVEVISLERLGRGGKGMRALRLLHLVASLEYDRVFVHMNPEYLVVAGWFWRLRGIKTGLWYTHKATNLRLRIATYFADIIFTASKESFRLENKKVQVMGHGIDADFFCPDSTFSRGSWALSVGRLMHTKRHDLAIEAAVRDHRELRIVGEGPELQSLTSFAKKLGAQVTFLGGLTQEELRAEYRQAAYLIHTSETGSLDKVVLEAIACGLPVCTNDPALKYLEHEGHEYVRTHHSLQKLIPAILKKLS